jgi:TRAP-type transport system small permease protein
LSQSSFPAGEKRRPLGGVERMLAAAGLAVICLITLANVVVRYFTNISFAATEEISIALMGVMTLLGSATAVARGRHIAVTNLVVHLPAPAARAAAVLVELATLTLFALLIWYGGRMAWDDYRFEVTSPGLGWPQWVYTVWLPVLTAPIVVHAAVRLVRTLLGRPQR